MADSHLSDYDILRFARHFSLAEIGIDGQLKLKSARVLIVGAGGIGSAAAFYLAAAGIGTIGIVDSDKVEISNLNRQILHDPARVGSDKTESAAESLSRFYPEIKIERHQTRLTEENVAHLVQSYDIVADGSDNFETRLLLNRVCYPMQKTLVMASAIDWRAQLLTFAGDDTPCYECVFGKPESRAGDACAVSGVVGAVTGLVGSLQAGEVVKEILSLGTLRGSLLNINLKSMEFGKTALARDPACGVCGGENLEKVKLAG